MTHKIFNFTDDEIMDFYKSISSKVRQIRKAKKISQLEVALGIDIKSIAFYSNCENNKYGKHFNLEHLYKISKILEVDMGEFFESEYKPKQD